MSAKKNNLAIWKIDTGRNVFQGLASAAIIERIISAYNDNEAQDDLKLTPIAVDENFNDKQVKLYNKKRISRTWEKFVEPILTNITPENRNLFQSINKDFLLFVYDKSDIFVLTAGAGYFAIQSYVDESFPLEVSKKIFKGEFKYSEVRDLVGEVYSKSENYRRSYSYSRSEAFGKIWKKLYGQIDPEVIRNSPELSLVLNHEKRVNAEMKSSFTFKKSVDLGQVVNLINAVQSLPELEPERKEKFKYLDTLAEVKPKKLKEALEKEFHAILFEAFTSGNFDTTDSFDFCHPENITDFLGGNEYMVGDVSLNIEHAPRSSEVLIFIKTNNLVNYHEGLDEFQKNFLQQDFFFKPFDGDEIIGAKLRKYFHGEVTYEDKTYFYVDGRWYQPVGSFFDYLLEDLVYELFDNNILQSVVPLKSWGAFNEGQFNLNHINEPNFYFGDRYYLVEGRGTVELFDLLYVQGDKLYIIQAKNGFEGSVRDAASQIEFSADVIEEAVQGDRKNLKIYYEKWHDGEKRKMTEAQFISLFTDKERIYVLASAHASEMTRENFEARVFQSKIAQFETLALCHSFKKKGRKFILQRIVKE